MNCGVRVVQNLYERKHSFLYFCLGFELQCHEHFVATYGPPAHKPQATTRTLTAHPARHNTYSQCTRIPEQHRPSPFCSQQDSKHAG